MCFLNKKIDKQKVKINFLDFFLCLSLSLYIFNLQKWHHIVNIICNSFFYHRGNLDFIFLAAGGNGSGSASQGKPE